MYNVDLSGYENKKRKVSQTTSILSQKIEIHWKFRSKEKINKRN